MNPERIKYADDLSNWMTQNALWSSMWYHNQYQYYEKALKATQSSNQSNHEVSPERRNNEATYSVPSFSRRFCAEVIDFYILLCIKLAIVNYLLPRVFGIQLSRASLSFTYSFDELQLEMLDLDDENMVQEMEELLLIGGIYKLIVIILEAICLAKVGFTPGKYILSIRVIHCTRVETLAPGEISVSPGGSLGFPRALLRSLIKNMSLTFFFPVVFTVMVLNNRTAYDMASNSVVVYSTPPANP